MKLMSNRFLLYQSRERRAAAWCLLAYLCAFLSAGGVVVCAITRHVTPALGCAVAAVLFVFGARNALVSCSYWSLRKHQEAYHAEREGARL